MSKHEWEPFRAVLDLALERLAAALNDAQNDLRRGDDNAAIGGLLRLDELHAHVQAALRLFKGRRFS